MNIANKIVMMLLLDLVELMIKLLVITVSVIAIH